MARDTAPTPQSTSRRLRQIAAVLGVLAIITLALSGGEALARVGGGQSFSGGGHSSGGSSGGGGGGGGDLIWLLIWLVINHPAIGVPLVIIILGVVVFKKVFGSSSGGQRYSSQRSRPTPPRRRKAVVTLATLRQQDANFSEPLFIDFVQLVYARAQELRPRKDTAALRPYLSEKALNTLRSEGDGLTEVRDVIFGATRIDQVRVSAQGSALRVYFETNLTEVRDDRATQVHCQERWTFRRKAGVLSPGPERMRALGCASCGSTQEPRADGTCPSCDAVRTGGHNQWEVSHIQVNLKRTLTAPELSMGAGVEAGTHLPTVFDPDLPPKRRAFDARHPDHSWDGFRQMVEGVFQKLQQAWSDQKWELARPHETDALFQVHRFWIERYQRFGLVNKLADVEVQRMELVKIDMDAFFESVTVRVWANMRDWTEKKDGGQIVGGSKKQKRVFTEYWTFIRAIGDEHRPESSVGNTNICPSCGAPLDNVSMAGVCGYCDSKITGGEFDWVLSRIEQDDVYAG